MPRTRSSRASVAFSGDHGAKPRTRVRTRCTPPSRCTACRVAEGFIALPQRTDSRLAAEPWRPMMLTVTVQDGTVDLWGLVHSDEQKKAARLAAELTPGVRAVVDNILVQRVGSGWS